MTISYKSLSLNKDVDELSSKESFNCLKKCR